MYQISNLGNVKSLKRIIKKSDGIIQTRQERIMNKRLSTDGYYVAKLNVNNKSKCIGIHRLVALAFIPNPKNHSEVNHIDYNRINNRVDNLEWCSHINNIHHSSKAGKYKRFGTKNSNYNKHTLSEKYKNDPKLAIEKLSRPKSQNGRSVSIKLFDNKHNFIKSFDWIGGCAEYFINNKITNNKVDTIRSKIRFAINNNIKYLNHYFEEA